MNQADFQAALDRYTQLSKVVEAYEVLIGHDPDNGTALRTLQTRVESRLTAAAASLRAQVLLGGAK